MGGFGPSLRRLYLDQGRGGIHECEPGKKTAKNSGSKQHELPVVVLAHEVGGDLDHDLQDRTCPDGQCQCRPLRRIGQTASPHAQYSRAAPNWDEGFNPNIRQTYDAALATDMADIANARRLQVDLYQHFAALFEDFDLVLCPGVSISPFPWSQLNPTVIDGQPVDNYMAWLNLTAAITIVGHPVTALPCGLDEAGLPFGIQVIGPMYGDHEVLSAAHALEQLFAADPVLARPRPDLHALRS